MSDITGLFNNKRLLLTIGALLVVGIGLWLSPRYEYVGPASTPTAESPVDLMDGYDRTFVGAVGVFDCGSGNYVGAIEPGRAYKLLADLGDGRLQLDIKGSGVLCVFTRELVP